MMAMLLLAGYTTLTHGCFFFCGTAGGALERLKIANNQSDFALHGCFIPIERVLT